VKRCLSSAALLLLAACQSTIEQGLDRREASEILARLSQEGIAAEKVASRDGQSLSIRVSSGQQERAAQILAREGLPRRRHGGFGAAYREKGLVSGRLEEQGRFLAALQEELAETLEEVDGVLSARVHLATMREAGPAAATPPPVSASVLIAFRGGDGSAPPIAQADVQRLVANAFAGLAPERVAVVFSRAAELPAAPPPAEGHGWIRIGAGGLGLGGVAAGLSLVWARRRARGGAR